MTNHSYILIFIIFIQGVGYGFQSRLSLKDIIHQISHVKRERERERERERGEREREEGGGKERPVTFENFSM
jgi:hypothetical protein